jgi:hypothetical protein
MDCRPTLRYDYSLSALDNRFSVDYSPFVVWGHSDVQPGMPPADSNPVSVTFFS